MTEETFYRLAKQDGVSIRRAAVVPMLTNRGHSVMKSHESEACSILRDIYSQLGGSEALLLSKRTSPLSHDFIIDSLGIIVEVDEVQHFSSERRKTLEMYGARTDLAFDVRTYLDYTHRWSNKADRYRAAKPTVDFPFPGGRRAQRAYLDAVRDLLAPAAGLRVLRVPAPECDPFSHTGGSMN